MRGKKKSYRSNRPKLRLQLDRISPFERKSLYKRPPLMLHNFFCCLVTSWTCARHKFRFTPSDRLPNLRQRRKQVHDKATRKCLTFQIRRIHRKKIRQWKATLLRKYLAHPARWKELQNIYIPTLTNHCINTLHWMSSL